MSFIPKGQEALHAEIRRALGCFIDAGAELIDVATLLPADVMLDLYGEDIRNRAFIVHDGAEGDYVLRPDFTVPVVEAHLASGAPSARYSYSGRVWRKKREHGALHKHSFWQIGLEIFDDNRHAQNDAEIFALALEIARPHDLQVITGDLGLVFSLLDQIEMPQWRRDALKRQFWRPRAFERLLQRYSSGQGKHAELSPEIIAPVIGLRSKELILARVERLKEDANLPPLKARDVELLHKVLGVKGTLTEAGQRLRRLVRSAPELAHAQVQFEERISALREAGVAVDQIPFDASFGRETMEYYDGFVFRFYASEQSVLAGGRYDQLVQKFGASSAVSAVGMAYRPELFLGEMA